MMNSNDAGMIMENAIKALQTLNLVGYGSLAVREHRRLDCMHRILIIIEQVLEAQNQAARVTMNKEQVE